MSVDTPEELAGLRRAGRAVVGRRCARSRGACAPASRPPSSTPTPRGSSRATAPAPAPALVYGFPGTICISVDDEAVHGIPGPRRLRAGELVKLDVTAELDGFFADAAVSVPVGQVPPRVGADGRGRAGGAARAGCRPRGPARR